MKDDFEDQVRLAIRNDEVEIPADTDAAIREGRRVVRGRRVGWGVAACTVVAAAALLLPGVIQRGVPAAPAEPGATVSASPASGQNLAGTEWSAVKLEGAALRSGTSITLSFRDGWVEGFGGCNNFGYSTTNGEIAAGAYHQDGDRLTIAPVATTEKGCANGVSDQEGRFLQAIPRVDHFLISSGGLVLQLLGADGGVLLQFEPAAPKLERTGWTVTAIKGVPAVAGTRPPSLVFLKGALSGFDGCNAITGNFSAAGAITVTASTFKLCSDAAISTQAENMKAALEGASRVIVQGDQLTLLGRAGTPLLQAVSEPARLLAAEGATWRLDNKDGDWGAGKDSAITLRVNDDVLFGTTGCSQYNAPYRHSGDAWTVSAVLTFKAVPCPNRTSTYAQRFIDVIQKVTSIQIAENQVRLLTPNETLSFSRK